MINADKYILKRIRHKEIVTAIDKCRYIGNYACHVNSLDYTKTHKKAYKIVGCIQVMNDDSTVAHFVVQLKDGTIIDPTYGRMSSTLYKYLVPVEVYHIDTFNPHRELANLKMFMYELLPWYVKLVKSHNDF